MQGRKKCNIWCYGNPANHSESQIVTREKKTKNAGKTSREWLSYKTYSKSC